LDVLTSIQADLIKDPGRGDLVQGLEEFAKLDARTRYGVRERGADSDIYFCTWRIAATFIFFTFWIRMSKKICRRTSAKFCGHG